MSPESKVLLAQQAQQAQQLELAYMHLAI